MTDHLLEIRDLSVDFHIVPGIVHAVRRVSWCLARGETLAILGESGSGVSVTAAAILRRIDCPPGEIVSGEIVSGEILFSGMNLLRITPEDRRERNRREIAMIFQDPLSALNPVDTVGVQILEMRTTHRVSKKTARARTLDPMQRAGIPGAETRIDACPHQFSGGQRRRLIIAMARALKHDILIADEPGTALDVTVQAQILALLEALPAETGMGLLLITHDLCTHDFGTHDLGTHDLGTHDIGTHDIGTHDIGIVAEPADRVVMQGGKAVEQGPVVQIFDDPRKDHSRDLMASSLPPDPEIQAERRRARLELQELMT